MKITLKKKTILLIIVAVILLSVATLTCYYRGVDRIVKNQYGQQSVAMARSVALSVDADKARTVRDAVMDIYNTIPEDQRMSRDQSDDPSYQDYLDNFSSVKKTAEFRILETSIQKIMEQTQVYDLRLNWADPDSRAVIYLVDATTDPDFYAGPGSYNIADESDQKTLDAPGLGFDPKMTNTDGSGWLMTTAAPLYDSNFHVIGFAEISIDMNGVIADIHRGMTNMAVILILIIFLFGALILVIVDRGIVKPINTLTDASLSYYSKDAGTRIRFCDLDIHTGDELEALADSMAMMERDIDDYITSLTETKDQLDTTREYAKEMDRIAYFDAMTGVRNKRAYAEALEELQNGIDQGDTAFGIAVIDLNDLKYYNDCFGHEKGDEAIRTVCRLTCSAFKRSPVFRFGGDEFAVILKGHDLENIAEIIARINAEMEALRKNEDLEPWSRISAAIGYALFDPSTDTDPDSVFKRADSAMYENKKLMKLSGSGRKQASADIPRF